MAASAGNKVSSASSDKVMSTGVPNTVVVVMNDSVPAVTVGGARPAPLGEAFVAVQVLGALLFAEHEVIGLRKACAIVAA